jgi:hypothetical protein
MEKFFASVEGLNTVLALVGDGGEAFAKNLQGIDKSAGATAEAFTKMTKTFDFQWTALIGKIKVGAKNIGTSFTDALIDPLMFVNKNFDIWAFQIGHTFAQVLDVTEWLVDGVISAFSDWRGSLDWIMDNVIDPIIAGFKRLYMAVVGGSYVPDLVREVIDWFKRWVVIGDIVNNFVLLPLNIAFRGLTQVLSGVIAIFNTTIGQIVSFKIPDFGAGFRTLTPELIKIEDSLQNILTIFAGGLGLVAIRKFLGIGIFALAFKLYDRLVGKITAYTGALRANRRLAFEAQQANFARLKEQEKFLQDQAKFAGRFGKTLQQIVDSGGSRSLLRRFFGGSDQWVLAKAKAQDAIDTATKRVQRLGRNVAKTGKQSLLSRAIIGTVDQATITKEVSKYEKAVKRAQKDLGKVTANQGFFSVASQGLSRLKAGFFNIGEAAKNTGAKISIFGNSLKVASSASLPIARLEGMLGNFSNKYIAALQRISPTAASVANNIRIKFLSALAPIGSRLKTMGLDVVRFGGAFNTVLTKVRVKSLAVRNSLLGRGIIEAALFGKKSAAMLTKLGVGVIKGVAGAAGRFRGLATGGIMTFLMFGDDIKAATSAARLTKTTGDVFMDTVNMAKNAANALPDTSIAMLALLGPVGMLAAAGILIFKHWDKIKEIFFQFVAWAKQQDWGKILLSGLMLGVEGIKILGKWLAEMTLEGFMLIGSAIADLGTWIWEKIVDAFTFDDFGEGLLDSLKDIGSKVIDLFLEWNPLTLWFKGVKKVVDVIKDNVGAADASSSSFENAAGATGGIVKMIPQYANGGVISGPGTGTSDSIPALLSDGEYVINAKATKMYEPLLKMINEGNLKFASGGPTDKTLRGGASLQSVFAANKSVESSKRQFVATFGNVDFEDMQQFLDTLFGLKFTKKDIEGFDPLLLQEIRQSMDKLDKSVGATLSDLEAWTPENKEMSNALEFSSETTSKWQKDLVDTIQPLLDVSDGTQSMADALKEAAAELQSFGEGWRDTIVAWQAGLSDMTKKGERAAKTFIAGVDGFAETVVNNLSSSDSLREALEQFFEDLLVDTAKSVAKDTLVETISTSIPGLAEAGKGAENVIQATGNVIINASGITTVNSKGGIGEATGGISKLLSSVGKSRNISGVGGVSQGETGGIPIPLDIFGGFADGGIPPVDQVSLVGEKGPELFLPSEKGRIIPNNKLKDMGGSPVNINQTLNITEAMNPEAFQRELVKNNQQVVGMVQQAYTRKGSRGPLG